MRFLSIFFRLFATAIILGLLGVFLGREMWLFVGSQQVARQAQRITQVARWQGQFARCQAGVALGLENPVAGIQLRFLDDSTYAAEIDCIGQEPVEVDRFTLPMWVTKGTGSAGFYYDIVNQNVSGELSLTLLRQSRVVFAEGNDIKQSWGKTEVQSALPVSSCQAHGLTCCDPVEFQGIGSAMSSGVNDCPGGCFGSCQRRPVLLSFQTDPILPPNRVLELTGGSELVLLAFTFDDQESPIQNVVIDYGDGTTDTFPAGQGQFEKEFVCASGTCTYNVTLTATDQRGVMSAATRLSSLQVVVRQ